MPRDGESPDLRASRRESSGGGGVNAMEASMCSCDYDGERCDVTDESWPVARKLHTCDECQETIHPGTRHQRINTLFDGRWETFRTCPTCAAIRRDYCAPLGCLREALGEALEFDYVTGGPWFYDDEDNEDVDS